MNPFRLVRNWTLELWRPGEGEVSARHLRWLMQVNLSFAIISTNVIGSMIVVALLVLNLVPIPLLHDAGHVRLTNAVVAAAYVLVSVPIGWWLGNRIVWAAAGWLGSDRAPTLDETRRLLYAPRRLFYMQIGLWLAAAAIFSVYNIHYSGLLAVRVATVVSLTGFVTAACAWLFAERILRSLVARAVIHGMPDGVRVPGVAARILLAWSLGTVVPVGGLMSIGIVALTNSHSLGKNFNLGTSIVALTATGILVGLLAVFLAVKTTSEPIDSVRRGLAQVQGGDFEVNVPVYDGSELGQLQIGFNEMVSGLAERERIRTVFGTYVDPDVADRIIESGTSLTGEEVDVTCMFIDVRGFTSFAERTGADQVVATLNEMFELTVPIIHAHDGRIDKFVGDGLLAVFGAPRRLDDHADQALAAAREIETAVAASASFKLSIGIGLNSGPVVAGNVGGGGRFEFSVIGDTVNVAARVEAATRQTDDVLLLSGETLTRLKHPVDVVEREGVALKGKHDPVKVFALAE